MTISDNINNRQKDSFVELSDGSTARRVLGSGIMSGVVFDYIAVTTNSDNDVYTYKTGGSGGSTVATITVTFTDSNKTTLLSVAKT